MMELDDIQHFLLTRTPALAARYEFLTFTQPAAGRVWLAGLIDKVGTGKSVGSTSPDSRWVTVAFTWNGLRALGIDQVSLMTFPEEFRQGMAARAEIIGTNGKNHPRLWLGGLASPELHAIVILFARDVAERERCRKEHNRYMSQMDGATVLSTLDLEAIPPYGRGAHEHFGYRDRLSHTVIEGTGEEPTPGSGPPVKAGEFFLGYIDESGAQPALPEPEILSRNGSYLAYVRMEEHVGAFRNFLKQHGKTPEEQELMAAKLMGRWRSGAPLVLSPHKDDPALGADLQRTNDFDYGTMDPYGYSCPVGSHIRRMNPRDTAENMQRHKMIRRGGTYGRPLPEGAQEDGVERGIAAFVGCASLVRQFEFAMNVWANDPKFKELGNERDPFIGTQDGTFDMTIPKRPIRKKIKGLPAFTTIRGGAYFFLPGIKALRFVAGVGAAIKQG
jgi:deferrochelatase/peroxidase EfeB